MFPTIPDIRAIGLKKTIAAVAVIAVTLFLWLVPIEFYGVEALTVTQQRTIAIFVFTALMWMFEIIPTWTTSVVTIVLILLTTSNKGIGFMVENENIGRLCNYKSIMASFADPVIMLFLGGFVLAIVSQKIGLDIKLARVLLKPFGTKPKFVLLGFLIVVGFFSMFMSNTATAAMMLTFVAPVVATLPKDGGGRISLALAIPIAANIGGMGTPIGTPPNAIALGALEEAGMAITFGQWMLRMVPIVIVLLLLAWVLLLKLFPFKATKIEIVIPEKEDPTPKWQRITVYVTFAVTIILWMFESVFKINSNVVAMIPFAVFAATGIFTREDLGRISWSVLWMVAGGFALGTALNQTGLAATLIEAIPFAKWNIIVVMLVGGLICYFLSNFISNSASANLIVPILAVVGAALSADPTAADVFAAAGGLKSLLVIVALCASLAMILPVSTPPNALAHSTGMVTSKQMAIVGVIMGAVGLVICYLFVIYIGF